MKFKLASRINIVFPSRDAFLPKPIIELLGLPKALTFRIRGKKVEVEGAKA